MSIVIDSSITLAWYFEDEAAEASDKVLRRVGQEGAMVPALWRYEVANGLQMAVRRRRINSAFRDQVFLRLGQMEINVDPQSIANIWLSGVQLAERHGLTVYDASYLELAQRRRAELATLDSALARAAHAERIPTIGR